MTHGIDGGPAFPMMGDFHAHEIAAAEIVGIEDADERDAIYTEAKARAVRGMSVRDLVALEIFARLASQTDDDRSLQDDAEWAFDAAEIFLKERDSRP